MHDTLKRTIFIFIVACAAMSYGHAQPKSLGTTFSFSGVGLTYEHYLNEESYINADIKAEMLSYFIDRNDRPGISASASCNFIVKRWTTRNGNSIHAFAGPGVIVGYAHDYIKDRGYLFGLKGRIGVECRFDRNVSISACVTPILGSHAILRDDYIEMKYYRSGMISTILPEIGIKYAF